MYKYHDYHRRSLSKQDMLRQSGCSKDGLEEEEGRQSPNKPNGQKKLKAFRGQEAVEYLEMDEENVYED